MSLNRSCFKFTVIPLSGSQPGFDDILPSSVAPDATSSITQSLSGTMVEGQRLYATVTCYNRAEQSSWASSDGVTIVTEPPSSSKAVVNVKAVSETQYDTRDGYQSQQDSLKGSWGGFEDPFGIHHYEVPLQSSEMLLLQTLPCWSTVRNSVVSSHNCRGHHQDFFQFKTEQ